MTPIIESPPLACNLSAHTPEQRSRHRDLLHRVVSERLELREFVSGYVFAFPSDPSTARMLTEYITLERLCCPFLTFSLRFEQNGGLLWLEVTGDGDAKTLIRSSFEAAM